MDNINLNRIFERGKAVAQLDARTYREISRDPGATAEAAIVVAFVAVMAGLGQFIEGAQGLVGGIIVSLLGWVVGAAIIAWVGNNVTGTPTTSGSIESTLRTIGYASAPNVFLLIAGIPLLGSIVGLVLWFWTLATTVFAIKAAFNMSTGRALATGIVGWVVAGFVQMVLAGIFGLNLFFTFN